MVTSMTTLQGDFYGTLNCTRLVRAPVKSEDLSLQDLSMLSINSKDGISKIYL